MARPFVYMNMAMSADGKITSSAREYPTFTSEQDRRSMDRLRAEADAVLIGAGTLRADDPPLGVRSQEMRQRRHSLGKPERLMSVLVTATANIDTSARFFRDETTEKRLVVTTDRAPRERLAALSKQCELWVLGRDRVDLPALLRRLCERGVERLLVEGGGELNWSFISEGLLDELNVTIAPTLLGGRDAPTLLEGDGFAMDQRMKLRLLSVEHDGDEIFCRYAVLAASRRNHCRKAAIFGRSTTVAGHTT